MATRRLGCLLRFLNPHYSSPRPTSAAADAPAVGDEGSGGAVLSEADRKFWEEEGYVIVRAAARPEDVRLVKDQICERIGTSPTDASTWYPEPDAPPRPPMTLQCQGMWHNRQNPRIHKAFAELWGTEELWVSFDGAAFTPPDNPPTHPDGSGLHWDLTQEILAEAAAGRWGGRVQGVLYLADVAENSGGFHCIPRFHNHFRDWAARCHAGEITPPDVLNDAELMARYPVKRVVANEGDLVIWHSLLPHGSSVNTSDSPRIAQFLTMFPPEAHSTFKADNEDVENEARRRVEIWRQGLDVASWDSTWDPDAPSKSTLGWGGGERDLTAHASAELSPLGEKLLGLRPWG